MLLRELVDLKPGTLIRGLTVEHGYLGRVASFSSSGWAITGRREAPAAYPNDTCELGKFVHVGSLELDDDDRRMVYTAEQLRNKLFNTHPYDHTLINDHLLCDNAPVTRIQQFDIGKDVGMYLGEFFLAYDSCDIDNDYPEGWIIGVKFLLIDGTVAYLRGTVDQDGDDTYNDNDGIISATNLRSFGDRQFLLC